MKGKKFYEQPATAVTRVELESSICGGSVDITVQSPSNEGAQAQAQEVNSDFGNANDFSNGNWD